MAPTTPGRVKPAGPRTYHLSQLNIGPRLTVGFAFIILAMLTGNAVLLWQFRVARAQGERLIGVDQELIAVLHANTNLLSFYQSLEEVTDSEDSNRLLRAAGPLRKALLDDSRNSRSVLDRLPPEAQPDVTLLPTIEAIHGGLSSQLEAIIVLGAAGEWQVVRLRLANEVRPLETRIAALVENMDREVSDERRQAVLNIAQAQQRILLIVPATALFTLLFAGLLGLAITRSITQPLRRLMEGSRALGRGEFQHRISVFGRDEFSHLGRAFNDTAVTLRDLYQSLRLREAYLAEAQRLSHTGSFGWNPSDGELIWSDETFRIFEYDHTVKPTLDLILHRTHPEDVPLLRQVIDGASGGATDWDLEHRLLMPDGSIKHVRAVARAIQGSSGSPGFVGAVVDLTPRKRAEEVLRQTQATLAHVTRVTTLGELTASIAHEVNQPLAGTITNSNTCLRWLARDPPDLEEARAAASRSVKDATRAADIIRRVRNLFKKGSVQQEPVDVNELVQETMMLLGNQADGRSVLLRADLRADLPMVMADRVQVQQVLMNLLVNGVEAMTGMEGARELVIRSELAESGHVQISVTDTGMGLAPEQSDQIFDAFFTTKRDGTGMGLAISRSIVEAHGGRLWAVANSGPGATFHFSLPSEFEVAE